MARDTKMETKDRARRACDPCKRRKVKCNGERSCQQCNHLGLRCTYSTPSAALRSRRSCRRGHVLAEYANRAFSPESRPPALMPARGSEIAVQKELDPNQPAATDFDPAYFQDLLSHYASSVFPVMPIITPSMLEVCIDTMGHNKEQRALVFAFGAITVCVTKVGVWRTQKSESEVISLLNKALETRGPIMPDDQVTISSIMILLFVASAMVSRNHRVNLAVLYLREAVTRGQILQLEESDAARLPAAERSQRQRLYWLLFIHERFLAISHYRLPLLSHPGELPEWDGSISASVQTGFNELISLFRFIDDEFMQLWLNKKPYLVTTSWIEEKQSTLANHMEILETHTASLTEIQRADIIVTGHWLRTLVWQIGLSKLLLGSDTDQDYMSITFPGSLSGRLRVLLTQSSCEAVEAHGSGIAKKIFEITSTLADIIVHVSTDEEKTLEQLDDFIFLYHFLIAMSEFYFVEKEYLQEKFETIKMKFPHLSSKW